MDCTTSNISATLKRQDQDENIDSGNCFGGGQRINKATTSCSNPTELGEDKSPCMSITKMMAVNKGKRTKRQRLHNSDPSAVPSSNCNHREDDPVDEEQLDMANCLILLAQGQSRPSSSYSPPPSVLRDQLTGQLRENKRKRSYSCSSLSLSVTGIYECKTCNRSFPSFQALGGHRASHKKLNIRTNTHHDYSFSHDNNPINSTSQLSQQLGNNTYSRPPPTPTTSAVVAQSSIINNNIKSNNKIHECSICGAEFSSGQALGGHMRRHRGPVIPHTDTSTTNTIAANTTLSLSTAIIEMDSTAAAAGKVDPISNISGNGFLSLDLNLPASPSPESDTKFSLPPKQQPAAMALFSSPALVDCFY